MHPLRPDPNARLRLNSCVEYFAMIKTPLFVLTALRLVVPRFLRCAGTAEGRSRAGARLWLRALCTLGVLVSMSGGAQAAVISETLTGASFANSWTLRGDACLTASGGGCGLAESPGVLRLTEDHVINSLGMATFNADMDLLRGVDVSLTRFQYSSTSPAADGMFVMLLDPSIANFGTGGTMGGGGPYASGLIGGVMAIDFRTYTVNQTALLGATGATGSGPVTVASNLGNPNTSTSGAQTGIQIQLYINGCAGATPLSVRIQMAGVTTLQSCYGPSSFGLSTFPSVVRVAVSGVSGAATERTAIRNLTITTADTVGGSYPFWDGPGYATNNNIEGGSGIWNPGSAFAGNGNWTNSGGATNTRWNGADTAVFGGTAGTITVDNTLGAVNINGMMFNTNGYTLSGGTLTGASATNTLTAGSGINATVGSILAGGTNGFSKSGAGTITLTGANTYTGATAVNAGTLAFGSPVAATNFNSPTTVASGAKLLFNGAGQQNTSAGSTVSLASGATLEHATTTSAGSWTVLNPAVTVAGTTTINLNTTTATVGGQGLFIDGGLKGTGTVTINNTNPGSGANFRTGNSTFTGTMIVNGAASTTAFAGSGIGVGGALTSLQNTDITLNGTMELLNVGIGWANSQSPATSIGALNGSGVVVGNSSATYATTLTTGATNNPGTFSGVIANGANNTLSITKAGSGTQTLSGANTYTGATAVNAGTLSIGAGGTTGTNDTSSGISIASGANLTFNRSDAYTASKIISGTGGTVTQLGAGTTTLTGANTYTGATTVTTGTLQVGAGSTSGTISGTSGVSVAAGTTLNFNRSDADSLAGAISGAGAVTKTAAGTMTLTGANTYTGTTTINAGTLQLGNTSGTLHRNNNVNINNGATLTTLSNADNTVYDVSAVGTGVVTVNTGGTATTGNVAAITLNGQGFALNGGTLSSGTPNGVWGSWILDGGSSVTANNSSTISASNLNMRQANSNFTVASAQNLSVTGTLTNSNGTAIPSGTGGGLTKLGLGTMTLSGANTYTGATTITGGTLAIGAVGGATGSNDSSSGISIGTGANLTFNRTDTAYIASKVISGLGSVTQAGTGTTTLTGASNYTGATTISAGTLAFGNNAAQTAFNSPTTVASGAKLLFNGVDFASTGGAATVSLASGATLENASNSTTPGYGTVFNGAVTVAGATTINQSAGSSSTRTRGLWFDGGLKGSGTVTVNSTNAGSGFNLRNTNNTFSGSMTVNGIANATAYSGSGISLGGTGTTMQNTDFTLNGTMELLDTGIGWANAQSAATSIGALNGTGVVVGNTGSTFASTLTTGATNNPGTFSGTIVNGANNTLSLTKVGTGTQKLSGLNTYTGATAINAGILQIGNAGTTGSIEASSGTSIATGANLTFNRTDAAYIASKVISGAGSVTQAGTGTTTLTGANTYTGATSVNVGTLQVGNGGLIGTLGTGTASIASGATLNYYWTGNDYLTYNHSGVGNLTFTGVGASDLSTYWLQGDNSGFTGTMNLASSARVIAATPAQLGSGSIVLSATGTASGLLVNSNSVPYTYTNNITLRGLGWPETTGLLGALRVENAGSTFSGNITLATDSRISVNPAGSVATITGPISGGFALNKTRPGTLTLAGTSTYTGATTVTDGTLSIGNGGTAGSNDSSSGIDLASGTNLTFNRSDAYSATKVISGAGTVTQAGTGGTTTLTGANTYTGATTITAGKLLVNGNQLSATGAVTVQTGATLGGSGTLGGVVTVNSGGILSPGNSPGTITVSGLSLPSGSTLNMELGQAGTVGGTYNDLVQDNGNLSLGGGTLNITQSAGGTFTAGTYRLINYTGTLTNSGGLVLGTIPTGFTASQLVIDTSTGGQVNLIVLPTAASYWDVSPQNDGAVNGGTGTWMPSGSGANSNWTTVSGATNSQWLAGGTANFGGTPGAVTVSGTVDIGGLSFTTGTAALPMYTLTGGTLNGTATTNTLTAGPTANITATVGSVLAGTNVFDKAGLGTITLTGANTYTGATTISAGMLIAASNTALGTTAGGTTVASGATLGLNGTLTIGAEPLTLSGAGVGSTGALRSYNANTFGGPITLAAASTIQSDFLILTLGSTVNNGGFALTLSGGNITASGVISGAGALTKTGSGTTLLSAANTYGGATTVSGGTLQLGAATNALPATTVITVASGATLDVNGKTQSLVSLSSTGTLALGTGGNLTLTSGANTIGAITGTGTITLNPGATLTLTTALSNTGVNIVLAGGTLNLGVLTHSIGTLSLTAASTLDFASAGTAQLTVATLNPAFALSVTNWTQGTDRFYATAVTGAPARDTIGISPLNNITLGGNAASKTAWQSSNNEINVLQAPTVAMVFSPTSVRIGANSTLTITLSNPSATPLSSAAFTLTYPANLINASPASGATTCTGGSVTAANGGNGVALSGGAIPANSSCIVTVSVNSNTAATYVNTLAAGALSSSGGTNAAAASASLIVNGGAITGTVFLDNGAGGGTANDGIRNGTEGPQSDITMTLGNCSGTTYSSTVTDGTGNYILVVPIGATNLCVSQTNQSGRTSTGASIGSTVLPNAAAATVAGTSYTYTRAGTPDTIAFVFNGTGHNGVNFGDVDNSSFGANGAKSSQPGNSVSYPHTFTARTTGSVIFSVVSSVSSPVLAGWNEKIIADPGCTGTLQAGAAVLYPPSVATPVTSGQQVCVIVQEMIPSTAQNTYINDAKIQATMTFSNANPALTASYSLDDVTTVSSSALDLKKEVRNVTQSAVFGINNVAKSGEVLEYRITYTNNGTSAISGLKLGDATPIYTSFLSGVAGTTPTGLTGCLKNTPANPTPGNPAVACSAVQTSGGTGTLGWQFTGALNPSATGSVLFQVRVD